MVQVKGCENCEQYFPVCFRILIQFLVLDRLQDVGAVYLALWEEWLEVAEQA